MKTFWKSLRGTLGKDKLILLVLMLMILSTCTSCGQQTIESQPPSNDNSTTEQTPQDPPATIPSADNTDIPYAIQYELSEEEATEFANALYQSCHQWPEVLAMAMSGYQKVVTSHNLPELANCDAKSLRDAMALGDNGGIIQELLLSDIKHILERAEVKYYLYSGPMLRYWSYLVNTTGSTNPTDVTGSTDAADTTDSTNTADSAAIANSTSRPTIESRDVDVTTFEDDVLDWKILAVTITYKDGTQETGYFEIEANYKRTEIDFTNVKIEPANINMDDSAASTDDDAALLMTILAMGGI